jgi:hypothetical protein
MIATEVDTLVRSVKSSISVCRSRSCPSLSLQQGGTFRSAPALAEYSTLLSLAARRSRCESRFKRSWKRSFREESVKTVRSPSRAIAPPSPGLARHPSRCARDARGPSSTRGIDSLSTGRPSSSALTTLDNGVVS